jgi:hypothetical protein
MCVSVDGRESVGDLLRKSKRERVFIGASALIELRQAQEQRPAAANVTASIGAGCRGLSGCKSHRCSIQRVQGQVARFPSKPHQPHKTASGDPGRRAGRARPRATCPPSGQPGCGPEHQQKRLSGRAWSVGGARDSAHAKSLQRPASARSRAARVPLACSARAPPGAHLGLAAPALACGSAPPRSIPTPRIPPHDRPATPCLDANPQ